MKKKFRVSFVVSILVIFLVSTMTSAQYTGYDWGTAYQVVNIGDVPSTITISYYDANGAEQSSATRTYNDVASLGSQLVVQKKDDPALLGGSYSSIISSSGSVAAIVNQQLYPPGSTNPQPPFSSYSGVEKGGRDLYLPAIMFNYYGLYTEMYIMNVGSGETTVDVSYYPTTVFGKISGNSGQTSQVTVKANATVKLSQQGMTNLGAPSGAGYDTGRFLGGAYLHSDRQDIAVVVNEHNPGAKKLLTYNGFDHGSKQIALPVHMRTFYDYFTALTIFNTSSSLEACVRITYTPATDQVLKATVGGATTTDYQPVVVEMQIPPLKTVMRYDGYTATDDQSDLDDDNPLSYQQFYGSVLVESITNATCATAPDLVASMNIESKPSTSDQAGSYNGMGLEQATSTLVAPIVIADYYGYFTNLTIQNTTDNTGTCTFEYTSGLDSAKPNQTKAYDHAMGAKGSITVYEGRKGTLRGDVNTDPYWRTSTSSAFIGAAKITCNNGIKVLGFTNEERDINFVDSMYTFNTINK